MTEKTFTDLEREAMAATRAAIGRGIRPERHAIEQFALEHDIAVRTVQRFYSMKEPPPVGLAEQLASDPNTLPEAAEILRAFVEQRRQPKKAHHNG